MTRHVNRRFAYLMAAMLVSTGNFVAAGAEQDVLVPDVRVIDTTPALMTGDFYTTGGFFYVVLAYVLPDEDLVHVDVTKFDNNPLRQRFSVDAPRSALLVSPDNRRFLLDVHVPSLGDVLVYLENTRRPAYEPATGCLDAWWGYEFVAPPSGGIAHPPFMYFEGTIAGETIHGSTCSTVGTHVSGFWYANSVRPKIL